MNLWSSKKLWQATKEMILGLMVKDKVGKKALSKLIKEIIALANTTGGYLVLGIEEKGKVRPRANKINPIPRIKALSEKLKLQIRDYVEPTINNIRFKEVETEDEKGVLIIRVEKSNLAPHRSLIDKECYIRRNDRSEKMTMREIKDLTILRIRSQQEIENEFKNERRTLS
ncbi:MAG: ATP-binding protein [Balneolaceae bacterium]|nr:ATP-binding protein [Balneolaceae bacterium]